MHVNVRNTGTYSPKVGDDMEFSLELDQPSYSKAKISSIDISFIRRETSWDLRGVSAGSKEHVDGRHKDVKDYFLSRCDDYQDVVGDLPGKDMLTPIKRRMVFHLPRVATNSCSGGDPTRGFSIEYGVLTHIVFDDSTEKNKFYDYRMSLHEAPPSTSWFKSDDSTGNKSPSTKFRLLSRSDKSEFIPGDHVKIDFAIVKKTRTPIMWVTLELVHEVNGFKNVFKEKKMITSCKIFTNKSSSKEQDYYILKKEIEKKPVYDKYFLVFTPRKMMGNHENNIDPNRTASLKIIYSVYSLYGVSKFTDIVY